MIQFILSISLVIFFILEIAVLRMLFAQQGKKMLKEIVESWETVPAQIELKLQNDPTLVPNKVTSRFKD